MARANLNITKELQDTFKAAQGTALNYSFSHLAGMATDTNSVHAVRVKLTKSIAECFVWTRCLFDRR